MTTGIFSLKTNDTYINNGFIVNCHECGKTFSPLQVVIQPSDHCEYFLGTYCRLCRVMFFDPTILCDCIKNKLQKIKVNVPDLGVVDLTYSFHWIYDPKDDMQGKIYLPEKKGDL